MHRKQEQLINTLYTKYARKIRDWAYRHTGNINIAEDIMQETFLILLIKIDEVIEHEDPRKWLFRTAKNVLLHAYRDMKQRTAKFEELNETTTASGYEHDMGLLEVFPSSFRPQDKQIMMMYYVTERSIKEIADTFGISNSACKMRLLRLREELRRFYSSQM